MRVAPHFINFKNYTFFIFFVLFSLTFWLNYGEWCQHIARTSCSTCRWWTISKTFLGCKFNSTLTSPWRRMEKSDICIQLDWDGHFCHTHYFSTTCIHTLVIYLELESFIIFYLNKSYEGHYENDKVCFIVWTWNFGDDHYHGLHVP